MSKFSAAQPDAIYLDISGSSRNVRKAMWSYWQDCLHDFDENDPSPQSFAFDAKVREMRVMTYANFLRHSGDTSIGKLIQHIRTNSFKHVWILTDRLEPMGNPADVNELRHLVDRVYEVRADGIVQVWDREHRPFTERVAATNYFTGEEKTFTLTNVDLPVLLDSYTSNDVAGVKLRFAGLDVEGSAKRHPSDPPKPEAAMELAYGRALSELGGILEFDALARLAPDPVPGALPKPPRPAPSAVDRKNRQLELAHRRLAEYEEETQDLRKEVSRLENELRKSNRREAGLKRKLTKA